MMKRLIIFVLFFVAATSLCLQAGRRPIVVQHGGSANDHWELPAPAVEPEVYYDDVAQEIIIVGTGNASYYNVVVESVND